MHKLILKLLNNKKEYRLYDLTLENRDELHNVVPDLAEQIEDDITLEQYLVVSGSGKKDYGITLVCVDLGYNITFRTKYDSGRIENGKDLKHYHNLCKQYLGSNWDMDMYREWAMDALKKNREAFKQYKIRKDLDSKQES